MSGHPNPDRPAIVRSPREVQVFHDIVKSALNARDAGRIELAEEHYRALCGAANLACWLLGHPNEDAIDDLLDELVAVLRAAGLPSRHPMRRRSA